eukprot:m.165724 g.165724  ORF g.165724 m.165724 type:complete len:128 (+) comp16602_c0_seq4:727-1110(+)
MIIYGVAGMRQKLVYFNLSVSKDRSVATFCFFVFFVMLTFACLGGHIPFKGAIIVFCFHIFSSFSVQHRDSKDFASHRDDGSAIQQHVTNVSRRCCHTSFKSGLDLALNSPDSMSSSPSAGHDGFGL